MMVSSWGMSGEMATTNSENSLFFRTALLAHPVISNPKTEIVIPIKKSSGHEEL